MCHKGSRTSSLGTEREYSLIALPEITKKHLIKPIPPTTVRMVESGNVVHFNGLRFASHVKFLAAKDSVLSAQQDAPLKGLMTMID